MRLFTRPGRLHWATLAFLMGFAALLVIVGYFYIGPGVSALAEPSASDEQRRQVRAFSSLLLVVLLVLLFVLMLVVFRIRRFFFEERPRIKTDYPDAWAESARRVRVQDDDEDDADRER